MVDRDWTPVKKGNIYCSPTCGRGCTMSEFNRATKAAEALVKSLGKGWEPRVWENLGWHYAVDKQFTSIHPPHPSGGKYTAYLNAKKQFIHSAKTPVAAYKGALKKARDFLAELTENIKEQGNG
jgi:hypothetical protein